MDRGGSVCCLWLTYLIQNSGSTDESFTVPLLFKLTTTITLNWSLRVGGLTLTFWIGSTNWSSRLKLWLGALKFWFYLEQDTIPAATGRKVRYTLDRSSACCRANRETDNHSLSLTACFKTVGGEPSTVLTTVPHTRPIRPRGHQHFYSPVWS